MELANSDDELASVDAFMEWLKERHPDETEFHQAVCGVVANVLDMVRDDRTLRHHRVLQRLTEPDRTVTFRVVWEDDNGDVQVNRGFRVQLSNVLGPYKGGLRFDSSVTASILKFLAFEQLFKNSLTGLNLGAGKGGADFHPRGRSDSEVMRFCQAYMTELHRHIGHLRDVPAGDIGVGAREIGYLFGQYRRLENRFSGALTGKAIGMGGSRLRQEATGYGAVYFLCDMLEADGDSIAGKSVAVSGAGNVAMHVAEKLVELGARALTLSNRDGYLCKEDGLSGEDIATIKSGYSSGGRLDELADNVGAKWFADEKPWAVDCDIAMPSATQNELDCDDASSLVDGGCRFVVEAANMPLTDAALDTFNGAGIAVAPGKASNAGGVAVSGFEMSQNRIGQVWTAERIDEHLRETMQSIFERCCEQGKTDNRIDYHRGADRAGFLRVAKAVVASGYM